MQSIWFFPKVFSQVENSAQLLKCFHSNTGKGNLYSSHNKSGLGPVTGYLNVTAYNDIKYKIKFIAYIRPSFIKIIIFAY